VSVGTLTVLGIETSCDETAASVVRGRPGAPGEILSNIVLSQLDEHAPYGGVVPEIAARAHIETLDGLIVRALKTANVRLADLDAIAATAGPGLIGGVIVGLMTAKGLCLASGKPLVAVNHLEGHALSARLTGVCPFPYLLLLVSGGHCQLLSVEAPGRYRLYGTTIDDAAGEAFDKTAKLLGLGYPGGPAIERAAEGGKRTRFRFPRPLLDREGMDFSFSGLKTSARYLVDELGELSETDKLDLAASFQAAIVDSLVDRTRRAIGRFTSEHGGAGRLVVAGGVAANKAIRGALNDLCRASNMSLVTPPPSLCTDNAAMIAWAGIERFALGQHDDLDVEARARWPLAA
jgi:N6-L-threonylcarbamoyladenine synthase